MECSGVLHSGMRVISEEQTSRDGDAMLGEEHSCGESTADLSVSILALSVFWPCSGCVYIVEVPWLSERFDTYRSGAPLENTCCPRAIIPMITMYLGPAARRIYAGREAYRFRNRRQMGTLTVWPVAGRVLRSFSALLRLSAVESGG